MPSRSPSNVYDVVGELKGLTPLPTALARSNVRTPSVSLVSPFWYNLAAMPATCGDAMLVPDIRCVPPPGFSERMPSELIKHPRLTSSWSSPGAEMVTPMKPYGGADV